MITLIIKLIYKEPWVQVYPLLSPDEIFGDFILDH